LNINENFIVEELSKGIFFLSNKETGTGYYVHSQRDICSKDILTNTPEILYKINYIIDKQTSPLKEKKINRLIQFKNPFNEKKLLIILLALFFIFLGSLTLMFVKGSIYGKMVQFSTGKTIIAFSIFLLGVIFVHELLHILISRMQNIGIFKYGIKLRYYFIPILYVRILPTGNNLKRANIAFAGNIADLLLLNIYASLYLCTGLDLFLQIFYIQMIMLLFNYNLFLPTDFYIFLFSLMNKSDFRTRAIKFTHYSFRISKKIDSKTLQQTKKTKFFYLLYGITFNIMILLFFGAFLFNMFKFFEGLWIKISI
jgi:hypothetical protein